MGFVHRGVIGTPELRSAQGASAVGCPKPTSGSRMGRLRGRPVENAAPHPGHESLPGRNWRRIRINLSNSTLTASLREAAREGGPESLELLAASSYPAKAGYPARRDLSIAHCRLWNTGSPGQAGRRQDTRSPSRDALCARVMRHSRPFENGGRRECRVRSPHP